MISEEMIPQKTKHWQYLRQQGLENHPSCLFCVCWGDENCPDAGKFFLAGVEILNESDTSSINNECCLSLLSLTEILNWISWLDASCLVIAWKSIILNKG